MKKIALHLKQGELIALARKEKNLTQSELAERLGIGRSALSNYENNKRKPRGEVAIAISIALEIPLKDII